MTSLASQDTAAMGGPLSILTRQKRDHERLDRLLTVLPTTAGVEQRAVLQEIARLDEHGTGIYSIEMGSNVPASGKMLRDLDLPRGCVLVGVQRGDDVHVPGPNDRLAAGDKLVAIAQEGLVRKLNALFT